MTDKELKENIADIIMDAIEEYNDNELNRPMIAGLYASKIIASINSLPEEPVSEEFEAFIKERVKNIPIVLRSGFHELCRQLIRDGAEWQKNNLWKDAQGDDLPEYEREVVVFTQNFPDDAGMMMVAIGHRPTPEGYDGKSLATGEIKHYTPKTYDKGGWNIPDVKYWLDCSMPKEIEL